jgi:hypothetical protein
LNFLVKLCFYQSSKLFLDLQSRSGYIGLTHIYTVQKTFTLENILAMHEYFFLPKKIDLIYSVALVNNLVNITNWDALRFEFF